IARWWRQRGHCTSESVPAPRLSTRHLLVLVGGVDSSSESGGVLGVRTTQLGYAPGDVVQFSYRGGTTREQPYGPPDTEVDLRLSARRLRQVLEGLSRDHPGVPVDLIAHSQGGLVVRAALGDELDAGDLAPLSNVVTLA